VEPYGPPPGGDRPGSGWAKTTQDWINALQTNTGAALAFFHEDTTDWLNPPDHLVFPTWHTRPTKNLPGDSF
jgi:hypothetical protein